MLCSAVAGECSAACAGMRKLSGASKSVTTSAAESSERLVGSSKECTPGANSSSCGSALGVALLVGGVGEVLAIGVALNFAVL